jgi:hypothetical protein
MATISEKVGRGANAPTDKQPDVSPARGLGGRQRTSTIDLLSQTPGLNVGFHDASERKEEH